MEIEFFKQLFANKEHTYRNKAFWYLLPTLKLMGTPFVDEFKLYSLTACGIMDYNKPELDRKLFCLLNIKRSKVNEFMQYKHLLALKAGKHYVTDYMFGDLLYDWLHMVVFELPVDNPDITFEHFANGRYSKMYDAPTIDYCFKRQHFDTSLLGTGRKTTYQSLIRAPERIDELETRLGIILPENAELDTKPAENEECFNYVF